MPTATDVARFFVQRYIDMGKPATNMKIQKLLYYAWIHYYRRSSGKYLFNDPICAWKFGPVMESVYREYRIFAAMPITFTKEPEHELDGDVIEFLSRFAEDYKDRTASQLVFSTHMNGTSWKKHYDDSNRGQEIPFQDIIEMECQ